MVCLNPASNQNAWGRLSSTLPFRRTTSTHNKGAHYITHRAPPHNPRDQGQLTKPLESLRNNTYLWTPTHPLPPTQPLPSVVLTSSMVAAGRGLVAGR